ncbi:MAG: hypothetical protein WAW42_17370 [Candidatus Competibacteraceae bacterium]|jgi:hypothetical protein
MAESSWFEQASLPLWPILQPSAGPIHLKLSGTLVRGIPYATTQLKQRIATLEREMTVLKQHGYP